VFLCVCVWLIGCSSMSVSGCFGLACLSSFGFVHFGFSSCLDLVLFGLVWFSWIWFRLVKFVWLFGESSAHTLVV